MREMAWDSPVFIGGLSYSGKTQLRQLLSSEDLCLQRRTGLWRHFGRFGDLDQETNRSRARQAFRAENVAAVLEADWDAVFAEFAEGDHSYVRLFGIAHRRHAAAHGCRRWGEQYGGVVRFAPQIFASYPEARVVHMLRHPGGRALRMLGRRRPGWKGMETAAGIESWRLAGQQAIRYPDRYRVLTYEELRSDPSEWADRIRSWIGEPSTSGRPVSEDEVRFDRQESLEGRAARRAWAFADAAVPGWPQAGSAVGTGESEMVPGTLAVWGSPVDALALRYRLYMANRGNET